MNPTMRVLTITAALSLACSAKATTTGATGDGGVVFETDTGASGNVCNTYCAAATSACPAYAMGDCVSTCATQYNRLSASCQATAEAYFQCAFSQPVTCGTDGRPSLRTDVCTDQIGPFLACVAGRADAGS